MVRTRFLDSVFPDWPGRLRYFRVFIFSRCVLTMYGATKPVTSVSGTHILLLLCRSVTPGLGQVLTFFAKHRLEKNAVLTPTPAVTDRLPGRVNTPWTTRANVMSLSYYQ